MSVLDRQKVAGKWQPPVILTSDRHDLSSLYWASHGRPHALLVEIIALPGWTWVTMGTTGAPFASPHLAGCDL